MPLRPASPRVLWADLNAFWRTRPRHQWVAAVLALLIPIGIVGAFVLDTRSGIMPRQQVIFLDSWPADRTDAQIKAKQKVDAAALAERRRARQEEFRRLDESLNRLGI